MQRVKIQDAIQIRYVYVIIFRAQLLCSYFYQFLIRFLPHVRRLFFFCWFGIFVYLFVRYQKFLWEKKVTIFLIIGRHDCPRAPIILGVVINQPGVFWSTVFFFYTKISILLIENDCCRISGVALPYDRPWWHCLWYTCIFVCKYTVFDL